MQQNQNIDRILQNQYICNFELEKSFVIASQQLLGGKLQNLIKVLGFRLQKTPVSYIEPLGKQ